MRLTFLPPFARSTTLVLSRLFPCTFSSPLFSLFGINDFRTCVQDFDCPSLGRAQISLPHVAPDWSLRRLRNQPSPRAVHL